jgi:PAS domain S-box-containing protein
MLAQIQQRDKALGESEKHFRSLIENANDIITILDAKGVMHYNSPSIQRILGYSPEELTNKPVFEFVHPDDASTVIATFLRVAQSPDQVAPLEFRVRHKNGSWVPLESIGKNLLDDPVVAGVVVNSRDISERKEAEERLKTYAAKLESSNRELQDFAYVASHDLQEPLRKIQAFGDRLKIKCSALLDEQNRDYLDRMQHAARRMQTLITDLLAFSRVTTKAQPFARVDLDKVTREVVTDLEVAIERTKGRVEVDELPTIEADPLQMRQLIQNLVGNALKFHQPNQPPLVKISSQILNGEHRHNNGAAHRGLCCQLTVEDNGIGFDEKYLDRIFIIFQRLHGRNEFEGTGVGLAICRKIVDRHGGEITATSKPGQGARFVVTLPVNQQQKEKP